ncbi:MAG: hypothetical protein J6X66_15405 [Lachnospiraceae bacterium]|nr:hypothetical protein [Lachnospiraceae bacterium]
MEDIKKYLYEALREKLGGELENDRLILKDGFSIHAWIQKAEEQEDEKVIVAGFSVHYDGLDEPVLEPVDAGGRTFKEAAVQAVEVFYAALWRTIEQAVAGSDAVHVPVDLLGEHYDFDMYCRSLVRIGVKDKEPVSLVKFIMDEIPGYLGSKKYYWIRINLAKYKEDRNIEIRINGSVCVELPKYYFDYVDNEMDGSDHYVCERQYALFVQREDDKCPFDKETVMDAAEETILRMADVSTEEEYDTMIQKSIELSGGDKNLATEIRIFIPEILAKLTMGTREGDRLFLLSPDGEKTLELKKSQVRSYFYVQQAVLKYLAGKPDKEDVTSIVMNSASYKAYCRAVEKAEKEGNKIEAGDLYVPGISYRIDHEGYRVW